MSVEKTIKLDLSEAPGEGGQCLRDALALSLVSQRPVVLEGVRVEAREPGLLRRHLAALHAAAALSSGRVEGGHLGSTRVRFTPGALQDGRTHTLRIGAGRDVLGLIELVLPALLRGGSATTLRLQGSTHVGGRSVEQLGEGLLETLGGLGAEVSWRVERPGFAPAGSGIVEVVVSPVESLRPLQLIGPAAWGTRRCRVVVAHLKESVGARQVRVVRKALRWPPEWLEVSPRPDAQCPGNAVMVILGDDAHCEVFSYCGRPGQRAELIAREVVDATRRFLALGARVSTQLTSQLLIPLASVGATAMLDAAPLNLRARWLLEVIPRFLDATFAQRSEGEGRVIRLGINAGDAPATPGLELR